jgi:lysophospholipase L1-like esterase
MNRLATIIALLLVLLGGGETRGQSPLPPAAPVGKPGELIRAMRELTDINDTIPAFRATLPSAFREVGRNEIDDAFGQLRPVMERLRRARALFADDSVRIVHIGDSHVRGHLFPQATGNRLKETFGKVSYVDMGVNGATCITFTHPERVEQIAALRPELLILSFGTNESYNRRYNAAAHYRQIDELVNLLRQAMPDVPILLTTPPGSYDRFRRRGRRTRYAVNPRVQAAADVIRRYAGDHQLAVWDMFAAVGGDKRACVNWTDAKLMRPDHVHFLPEGYALQGDLLYEAFIKAYNRYVSALQ